MKTHEICEHCHEPFSHRTGDFDYTDLAGVDGYSVTLHEVGLFVCRCGEAPVIQNLSGLSSAIALALIEHDQADLPGRSYVAKWLRMQCHHDLRCHHPGFTLKPTA